MKECNEKIFESSLFCLVVKNGGTQQVEVTLFILTLMTVPFLRSFIGPKSRHITSGSPNYEANKKKLKQSRYRPGVAQRVPGS